MRKSALAATSIRRTIRLGLFSALWTIWIIWTISSGPGLLAEDWPRFRGPTGQGISAETGVPVRWGPSENIAWKTAIPGEGWSSPAVAAGKVFLTSAEDGGASCRVICVDAQTGGILWNREVFRQTPGHKQGRNSYATGTPAADGERVYASFYDGSIAALSLDGTVAWTNREHRYFSEHGPGVSPILHKDLFILPYDGSSEGDDKALGWRKPWDMAFILALEKSTGKLRWKASRGQSRIAHVTPNVLSEGGRDILASAAGDVVQGHDLGTGELLWTARSQGEGVVPSIVLGEGLIFTASGFESPTIRAVRPGGKGDVTKTHIAWEDRKGVPKIPSFLYLPPHLFVVTDEGLFFCREAVTGKIIYQQRLEGQFTASPVSAEGRIYLLSDDGTTTVIEAGPKYNAIATNKLGEKCQASPAISGKRIYIRTERNLICIGK